MINRRPRLADVAEHAGVSMKTVSNVINDYQHVSAATRERVLASIGELGYRPNLSARNLARGRAGMIALVVPQLDRPYFAALARHVIDAAHRRGLVVLIEQTGADPGAERRVLSGDITRRVDGMIFSPVAIKAEEISARAETTPLVLLGEQTPGADAPRIAIDNAAAAELAVRHLVELGRIRPAMIGIGRPRRHNPRYLGFRAAVAAAGLRTEQRWLREVRGVSGADGEQAMEQIIAAGRPLPDALFCATDWLALGAIRCLQRHGIGVPEEIAVIGFDDIPYGEATTPSLSTIATDRAQIADRAVTMLMAMADGVQPPDPEQSTIDFRLVVRESTAGRS